MHDPPTMNAPDGMAVAVAVVSFQTRDLLRRCLTSVRAARPVETVVVDNGSTDGSIELVGDAFPDARLLVNDRNRGYGAAANQALTACTAPAVLLLNSDTELEPAALRALGRYLAEHPAAGVVGPRLADPDGRLQPSTLGYPSAADMLMGDTGLHVLVRRLPLVRECFLRTWAHDAARIVPWVSGAALAIRRSAFDTIGGFDERYFMYYEEVDLCQRMAAAGFETHYAPVTTVAHARSASTSQQAPEMRRQWLVSYRRYLATHETRRSRTAQLGLLRAFMRARATRERLRRLAARDPGRRRLLATSIAEWDALLGERELWKR
jgi:N-acetylglucosaminyl-diphospho-decaprenol L-rhamnosyltransferase